jgi:hypothetical protein
MEEMQGQRKNYRHKNQKRNSNIIINTFISQSFISVDEIYLKYIETLIYSFSDR